MVVQGVRHFAVSREQRAEPHGQHGPIVDEVLKHAVMIQDQAFGLLGVVERDAGGRHCQHADERRQAIAFDDPHRVTGEPRERGHALPLAALVRTDNSVEINASRFGGHGRTRLCLSLPHRTHHRAAAPRREADRPRARH